MERVEKELFEIEYGRDKKYRAKIKVEAYKNGTKWYEIQKIIAEK